MAVFEREGALPLWRRRTTQGDLLVWFGWLLGVALLVACFQFISERRIWAFVSDAPQQGADLVGRMFPPRRDDASQLWKPLWDTINIATLGTGLAVLIGVPLAFLAAHNTPPSVWLMRPVALFVIVASRSINSLIWALVLVIILGPGELAGPSPSRCAPSDSSRSCSTRRSRRSTPARWRRFRPPARHAHRCWAGASCRR
jgi:phosphonate transport system permease protein